MLVAAGDGVAANERQLREVETLVDAAEARPSVRPARVHTVLERHDGCSGGSVELLGTDAIRIAVNGR